MGADEAAIRRTAFDWLGRIATWLVAIVGGWYFGKDVIERLAEHHPLRILGMSAVIGLLGYAIYRFKRVRAVRLEWMVPLVAFLVIAAYEGWAETADRRSGIENYCSYGVVSQAQMNECASHVSSRYIEGLHTDAARFARNELDQCLADAGPYCAHALRNKELIEEAPGPNE